MSNNQKKACGVASGPRDNWIKEEREGRPCATERVLISSNFLCFAHTAFYQLLPDWLSLYHSERWLTGPQKVLIFKCVTSFSFRGQSLKRQLCVWCESGFCVLRVWLNVCHRVGGLFWFIKVFFPDKAEEQPAPRSPFSSPLPFSSRWRGGKWELGGWRECRRREGRRWYHNKCFH